MFLLFDESGFPQDARIKRGGFPDRATEYERIANALCMLHSLRLDGLAYPSTSAIQSSAARMGGSWRAS